MAKSKKLDITQGNRNKGIWIMFRGFDAVTKGLKLNMDQKKQLKAFLQKEGEALRKKARQEVPKKTKRLHASHNVLPVKMTKKEYSVTVRAGGTVETGSKTGGGGKAKLVAYAAAVHEGSKTNPNPNPWLRRSLENRAKGFARRLAKAIKLHKLGK